MKWTNGFLLPLYTLLTGKNSSTLTPTPRPLSGRALLTVGDSFAGGGSFSRSSSRRGVVLAVGGFAVLGLAAGWAGSGGRCLGGREMTTGAGGLSRSKQNTLICIGEPIQKTTNQCDWHVKAYLKELNT